MQHVAVDTNGQKFFPETVFLVQRHDHAWAPQTRKTPMSQSLHARFKGPLWRCGLVQGKGESMLSGFMLLDFCEHNLSRKDCVSSAELNFHKSVTETVLLSSFVKWRSRRSCTDLFWKPFSKSLVSFFALVRVLQSTQSRKGVLFTKYC